MTSAKWKELAARMEEDALISRVAALIKKARKIEKEVGQWIGKERDDATELEWAVIRAADKAASNLELLGIGLTALSLRREKDAQ